MAGCLLDRPHLCAAGSPSHRDGGDWHLLHAACYEIVWVAKCWCNDDA